MTCGADSDVTHDALLGGRLCLAQPRSGYRAGVDPVLLAATIQARAGQSVLDLGCGVGTAMLCLHTRVPGLSLTGVDLNDQAVRLARRNVVAAGAQADVHSADLRDLPDSVRQRTFDHVITNPPYFDRQAGARAADPSRDLGRGGELALANWLDIAVKRVRPKGFLSLIHPVGRLDAILSALHGRLGSIRILPLVARAGRAPHLVIVRAQHQGRAGLVMAPGLIMHRMDAHRSDAPDYTDAVIDILRHGKNLPM